MIYNDMFSALEGAKSLRDKIHGMRDMIHGSKELAAFKSSIDDLRASAIYDLTSPVFATKPTFALKPSLLAESMFATTHPLLAKPGFALSPLLTESPHTKLSALLTSHDVLKPGLLTESPHARASAFMASCDALKKDTWKGFGSALKGVAGAELGKPLCGPLPSKPDTAPPSPRPTLTLVRSPARRAPASRPSKEASFQLRLDPRSSHVCAVCETPLDDVIDARLSGPNRLYRVQHTMPCPVCMAHPPVWDDA